MSLTVVTWNVNSLRSAMRRGFLDWLQTTKPDVVCLQEVRALREQLHPLEPLFDGYRCIWNPAERAGYAGTAVLTRFEPVSFEFGLNGGSDPQGRSLTVDFGDFRVGSFYAPNSTPDTPKIPIKQTWLEDFREHVAERGEKPFIVTGDLNVAYKELDSQGVAHPYGMNGCTREE